MASRDKILVFFTECSLVLAFLPTHVRVQIFVSIESNRNLEINFFYQVYFQFMSAIQ